MRCIDHKRTSCCLQSPPKNLVHIQFISKLFCPLFSFCFHWRKHYQTCFYFILDRTVQRRGLISLFVLSVLGFSHGSLSSRPCFTLSPGSPCWEGIVTQHCARPGAGTQTYTHSLANTHTKAHTYTIDSPSPIFKKNKIVLLLCFPCVIVLRDSFLRADLKHVVARDLDRRIAPINICSPGLLSSFQKATTYTPTHTYIYMHSHSHTHTLRFIHGWQSRTVGFEQCQDS